jgi:hypothetical protein
VVNPQLAGFVLLTVGVALLWSVWAFVIAGALLVVVPELVAVVGRRRVA